MTVIELSAGRKHTIKVGDKVQEVTLRPDEIRYLPFLREIMDMPKVPSYTPPEKQVRPKATGYVAPPYTPPISITYDSWSRARPKPTFDDIIALVEGVRGRRNLGFTPSLDNLVHLLRKYRK